MSDQTFADRVNAELEKLGADPLTPDQADALDQAQPSGLPQSEHGGLHPELRARMTAATAAVGDFKRETDAYIDGTGERPLFEDYAWRLYTELKLVLRVIEEHQS